MMKDIFSLHSYFIVNGAIIASYVLARLLMSLPIIAARILQNNKLKYARYCLLISITMFVFMPLLTHILSIRQANLEFEPVFQHASHLMSKSQAVVTSPFTTMDNMPTPLPMKTTFILIWTIGFLIHLFNYVKTLSTLHRLKQTSFRQHKIGNTHILFNTLFNTPFCWSFFQQHYIALPTHLAEHITDRRISIRHELQHIRQGDTNWLHFMQVLKLFCFWNPFLTLWMNWFRDLQEFACDEQIVLHRKMSPAIYAQCLVNSARHTLNANLLTNSVIAINGVSKSTLYRRVNMLFTYQNNKRKLSLITAYTISFCAISTAAIALNGASYSTPVSPREITALIKKSELDTAFHIKATPEVVAEINRIRTNDHARANMLAAMERMNQYKAYLKTEFRKQDMPNDLLALPLIESGYKPLEEKVNPVRAAGIWQIIPSTGDKFGLIIDDKRDDRMNMEFATHAALKYLHALHAQFHDWKLAIVAYEIGEVETERLIHATGSRDAWTIARSNHAKDELKKYLAMFDASVILINHPKLISA